MSKFDNIEWTSQNAALNQIYSSGIEFCFINDDAKQCTVMVMCKDYLHDAIWAARNKEYIHVYGFIYDAKKHPEICLEKTILGIGDNSNDEFYKRIDGIQDLLNQIEVKLNFQPTRIHKVNNAPSRYASGFYVLEGTKEWMHSSPMISLYSLLIRIGRSHTVGVDYLTTFDKIKSGQLVPEETNDRTYLCKTMPVISHIISNGHHNVFGNDANKNYPKYVCLPPTDPKIFHNYGGIVRCDYMQQNIFPFWKLS